nr:hypothetical protein [uncultured Anaerocolumna sp.]
MAEQHLQTDAACNGSWVKASFSNAICVVAQILYYYNGAKAPESRLI